ncbi:hypothetical protein [Sphaerospermopsis aphanizomenoides]|uniref:hypothetical protein n=1 Tax=Sphaerospermopsis aphanizomenoides TaxID=459663 RepID=UPI001F4345A8|nr:hypothetical protein [Sphaerospermopsis aphanizomenoides]
MHIASKTIRWQLESTPIKVFDIIAPLVDTPMTQGRGQGKIHPDALVEEFWRSFSCDNYEMLIGKSKSTAMIFAPNRGKNYSSRLISPSRFQSIY